MTLELLEFVAARVVDRRMYIFMNAGWLAGLGCSQTIPHQGGRQVWFALMQRAVILPLEHHPIVLLFDRITMLAKTISYGLFLICRGRKKL